MEIVIRTPNACCRSRLFVPLVFVYELISTPTVLRQLSYISELRFELIVISFTMDLTVTGANWKIIDYLWVAKLRRHPQH